MLLRCDVFLDHRPRENLCVSVCVCVSVSVFWAGPQWTLTIDWLQGSTRVSPAAPCLNLHRDTTAMRCAVNSKLCLGCTEARVVMEWMQTSVHYIVYCEITRESFLNMEARVPTSPIMHHCLPSLSPAMTENTDTAGRNWKSHFNYWTPKKLINALFIYVSRFLDQSSRGVLFSRKHDLLCSFHFPVSIPCHANHTRPSTPLDPPGRTVHTEHWSHYKDIYSQLDETFIPYDMFWGIFMLS